MQYLNARNDSQQCQNHAQVPQFNLACQNHPECVPPLVGPVQQCPEMPVVHYTGSGWRGGLEGG